MLFASQHSIPNVPRITTKFGLASFAFLERYIAMLIYYSKAGIIRTCYICSKLDPEILRINEWLGLPGITISHHVSLAALVECARDGSDGVGCDLCRLIHNHIYYGDYTIFDNNTRSNCSVKLWRTGLALFVRCGSLESVIYDYYSSQECIREFPPELGYLLQCPNINSYRYEPTLEEKFQLISNWISKCITSHKNCCTVYSDKILSVHSIFPTRVIDVGPADGSQEPHLFVPSREWRQDNIGCLSSLTDAGVARYITLSYCWRKKKEPFLTTRENLKERQRRMLLADMPKTLQDAIFITKKLGVQYLWVDALCIIQNEDDQNDWKTECKKMADVYRYALCTISAASGHDVDAGCFIDRSGLLLKGKQRYINSVLDADDGDKSDVICIPNWTSSVLESPLNNRGWVLQERALSTRILHWTKDALYWECDTMRASEFQPSSIVSYRPKTAVFNDEPLMYQSEMRKFLPKDCTSWAWFNLLQHYSWRELSCASDRLPALHGLAKTIQHHTGDIYIAGHWKSSLIQSLCWYVNRSAAIAPRPSSSAYIAPTWSWASPNLPVKFCFWAIDNGPINHNPLPIAKLFDHVEVNCQGLFSAWILLRGKICTITLPNDSYGSNVYYYSLGGRKSSDRLDLDHSSLFEDPRYVMLDRHPKHDNRTFRCLQVCQFDHWFISSIKFYGALVLESTQHHGTFKRLGWARLSAKDFEGVEDCFIKLI